MRNEPSDRQVCRTIFPNCRRILGTETWGRVRSALGDRTPPDRFPDHLQALGAHGGLPAFLADLARLEWAVHLTGSSGEDFPTPPAVTTVNPTLTLLPVAWGGLPRLLETNRFPEPGSPSPKNVHVMVWRSPGGAAPRVEEAADIDLLALKLVVEGVDTREAAGIGGVSVGEIDAALAQAVQKGILLSPETKIRRRLVEGPSPDAEMTPFLAADAFTLQWHITQDCDLHCRHCYDRSRRPPLTTGQALGVLDDFHDFCRRLHVRGHVSFTGGNPLLYPGFPDVYRAASELGFATAILGNPTPVEELRALAAIAEPQYFQVSLEGLQAHNDHIRGARHFERTLAFLDDLGALGIYRMVMLTLTRDNLDQVLPLGRLLEGRADFFTFNRLSAVGEGAALSMADPRVFETFLRRYESAAASSAVIGLKDNLFNVVRREKGLGPFGGCTGFGCGAAFNFVALLPDGEVHACRKFPSVIGNLLEDSLWDVYRSERAAAYRSGSEACRGCELAPVCRGCLAVTYSCGLDVFKDRDPFCFKGGAS